MVFKWSGWNFFVDCILFRVLLKLFVNKEKRRDFILIIFSDFKRINSFIMNIYIYNVVKSFCKLI